MAKSDSTDVINITDDDNKTEDEVYLSDEQKQAFNAVKAGKNVFITGSAGVGKSYLLNLIIKSLPRNVGVTASTGVAACNIGGTTLHSFAGIGLGDKDVSTLCSMVNRKRDVKERWLRTKVLVIDEISMIDGYLFDKVNEVAKAVRRDPRDFGGIQLILCGDFLQLPPVNVKKFAFETQTWKSAVHQTIVLKKVFRQKQVGFVTLLNRLRYGMITSSDIEVLHICSGTLFPEDGIKPTRLFPHRWSVEKENMKELKKLQGESYFFYATDWAKTDSFREQLNKNSRYWKELELKVGAQVMLLYNKDIRGGLVNGTRGVVVGFQTRQHPKGVNDESDEDDDDVNQLMRYPIVKFVNGIELPIGLENQSITLAGTTVAWRNQIPLALAWAVSIHKSQGMTMERVEVNIAKAFEHGQAYVALSRVTGLDGLLLRDFDPGRITAHPKVLKYCRFVDPTFEASLKTKREELRDFIESRRDYVKYKKKIEQMTLANRALEAIADHDYCSPKVSPSGSPTENREKVFFIPKNAEISDEASCSSKPAQNSSPSLGFYIEKSGNSTVGQPSITTCSSFQTLGVATSSDGSCVVTSTPTTFMNPRALEKLREAQQRVNNCRDMISEIHNVKENRVKPFEGSVNIDNTSATEASKETPNVRKLKNVSPVLTEVDEGSEPSSTAIRTEGATQRRSKRLRGKKRKAYAEMNNHGFSLDNNDDNDGVPNISTQNTPPCLQSKNQKSMIVIDSDPEELFDPSFFKDDIILEAEVRVTHSNNNFNASSSTPCSARTNKTAPSFLSNICPDLINSSQDIVNKTFTKTRIDIVNKSFTKTRVNDKPNAKNENGVVVVENPDKIKRLLIEKEELIEQKRRQALDRRLMALKRRSMQSSQSPCKTNVFSR